MANTSNNLVDHRRGFRKRETRVHPGRNSETTKITCTDLWNGLRT